MRFTPNARQTLAIFVLLFARTPEEREPMQSKLKPKLDSRERRQLVEAGLLEFEARGRATHVRATDKAWDWAGAHLDATLPRSIAVLPVLQSLLMALRTFLPNHELTLAHLFLTPRTTADLSTAQGTNGHVRERIREAIFAIGGGSTHQRVRLSDLRASLEDVPRERLDRELLAMQAGHRLVLYRLDNPAELTAADRQAELFVGGHPRHLVYLEA